MNLEKLKASYKQTVADMQAMIEKSEDAFTDEQKTNFDALKVKASSIKGQIEDCESLLVAQAEANAIADAPNPVATNPLKRDKVIMDNPVATLPKLVVPARAKRWSGNLKAFKGENADEKAYTAGMFLAATLFNSEAGKKFCAERGIPVKTANFSSSYSEGTNSAGGYLVYDEYENSIIRLVEQYGLARRLFRTTPMVSDTKIRPRRTGGLTSYFIGEGDSLTESTGTWDNVKLIARKLGAISVASNEVMSDAIISIADNITTEIALAFAIKEDLCALQGDGTSTYGGIQGMASKLLSLNGVTDGGGVILGAGNLISEITDGNLMACVGRVPNYPGMNLSWVCSKPFYYGAMERLARAAGGNTYADIAGGQVIGYGGYPVHFTSGTAAMPVSDSNSQVLCLFGDYSMAADFGDRAGMTIATTTEATVGSTSMFDTDSFAVRGIERFDINVHDIGTAAAAGPVVALISAAS